MGNSLRTLATIGLDKFQRLRTWYSNREGSTKRSTGTSKNSTLVVATSQKAKRRAPTSQQIYSRDSYNTTILPQYRDSLGVAERTKAATTALRKANVDVDNLTTSEAIANMTAMMKEQGDTPEAEDVVLAVLEKEALELGLHYKKPCSLDVTKAATQAAWQSLTDQQREAYNERAKKAKEDFALARKMDSSAPEQELTAAQLAENLRVRPGMLDNLFQPLATHTDHIYLVMAVGPNGEGGMVTDISYYGRNDPFGQNFMELYKDFTSHISTPFRAFGLSCYGPEDIRKRNVQVQSSVNTANNSANTATNDNATGPVIPPSDVPAAPVDTTASTSTLSGTAPFVLSYNVPAAPVNTTASTATLVNTTAPTATLGGTVPVIPPFDVTAAPVNTSASTATLGGTVPIIPPFDVPAAPVNTTASTATLDGTVPFILSSNVLTVPVNTTSTVTLGGTVPFVPPFDVPVAPINTTASTATIAGMVPLASHFDVSTTPVDTTSSSALFLPSSSPHVSTQENFFEFDFSAFEPGSLDQGASSDHGSQWVDYPQDNASASSATPMLEWTDSSTFPISSDTAQTTPPEQGQGQAVPPAVSMFTVFELLHQSQLPPTAANTQVAFDHLKAQALLATPSPPLSIAPAPSSVPPPATANFEQLAQFLDMNAEWFSGLPDYRVPAPSVPASASLPPSTPATEPLPNAPDPPPIQVVQPPVSSTPAPHVQTSSNEAETQSRKGKRKLLSNAAPPPKKRTKDSVDKAPVLSVEEPSAPDPLRRTSRRTAVPAPSANTELLEECIREWLDSMCLVKMGKSADRWDHILRTFRLLLIKIAMEDPQYKRKLPQSAHCPSKLLRWMKDGCDFEEPMDLTEEETVGYQSQWLTWWNSVQPITRRRQKKALLPPPQYDGKALRVLRCGGRSGLIVFLIGLFHWGASGHELQGWQNTFTDFCACVDALDLDSVS